MMGYNSYSKIRLLNLPKKLPFEARPIWTQFGPKLYNLMSHDSLSEDLFELLWHDETQ